MKTKVIVHNKNWIAPPEQPYVQIISDKIRTADDLRRFIESVQHINVEKVLIPKNNEDHVQTINA